MIKSNSSYQDNFILGMKIFMARENLANVKKAALRIGITYMSLYKIMDKSNKPTAEHGITLCEKAGFSANWMFLNKGQMDYEFQANLNTLLKELKNLKGITELKLRKKTLKQRVKQK